MSLRANICRVLLDISVLLIRIKVGFLSDQKTIESKFHSQLSKVLQMCKKGVPRMVGTQNKYLITYLLAMCYRSSKYIICRSRDLVISNWGLEFVICKEMKIDSSKYVAGNYMWYIKSLDKLKKHCIQK